MFGAGASRHVGYPLAGNMGTELFDWMRNRPSTHFRQAADLLAEEFGQWSNIEDLITNIGNQSKALRAAGDKAGYYRIGSRRGALVEAIRSWFCEIRLNQAPAYAKFADQLLAPGDVIITFNYDDSLERELTRTRKWDVSRGYGFPLSESEVPSGILVLNLHGSINWLVELFGGAVGFGQLAPGQGPLGSHPVIHQTDLEYLGLSDFKGSTYRSGGAPACLILPGRQKEFFYDTSSGVEYADFWNTLWSQAAEALTRADEILICGYGLQPVDGRARDLMLGKPNKAARMTVICGGQTERILKDLQNAGFANVEARGGHFEGWIEGKLQASN